jgi:hypothetical protein
MTTPAQFTANRENAQYSTGPATAQGRARSSGNAVRFGLFSTKNCVRPEETEEYEALSIALWTDLHPQGPIQEMFATEVVRSAWRLRRCVEVEATLAEKTTGDPMLDEDLLRIQTSVDRARTQAHGIMRRSLADLHRLRAESPKTPIEVPVKTPAKPTQSGDRHMHESNLPCPDCDREKALIPRNAACPCGSGQKYKRCCGRNAPAVLNVAVQQAA